MGCASSSGSKETIPIAASPLEFRYALVADISQTETLILNVFYEEKKNSRTKIADTRMMNVLDSYLQKLVEMNFETINSVPSVVSSRIVYGICVPSDFAALFANRIQEDGAYQTLLNEQLIKYITLKYRIRISNHKNFCIEDIMEAPENPCLYMLDVFTMDIERNDLKILSGSFDDILQLKALELDIDKEKQPLENEHDKENQPVENATPSQDSADSGTKLQRLLMCKTASTGLEPIRGSASTSATNSTRKTSTTCSTSVMNSVSSDVRSPSNSRSPAPYGSPLPNLLHNWLSIETSDKKTMMNRYAVLDEGYLNYYAKPTTKYPHGGNLKGCICLAGYVITLDQPDRLTLKNVTGTMHGNPSTDFSLEISSVDQRRAWIVALNHHIKHIEHKRSNPEASLVS